MNSKEKLPKLVDVCRPDQVLGRRQLPLVVDATLTLVMDIKGSGIITDNQVIRGKEHEEFVNKWKVLSEEELRNALKVTIPEMMQVLNQNVPCVGCRRSVERLCFQLQNHQHPTLDPLVISDGKISIRTDKQIQSVVESIFHDHALRLSKLIENQPKRNKKSVRCLLHSLESQRPRPLTSVWRDVWDCMKPECKKDVCLVEATSLRGTLETYLRKHRFCGECRTKVLKAYSLLMEESEPIKEKGYVAALYNGIKRCLPDKHIHLQTKTDYITKLISRAEPELLGSFSRRERHAKTLEIAQEEVLTCLGICMYERLHRIYMRMREEECTCQVFAAVAVHTLSRNFETAVERARGISQLELLFEEFAREEQQKQIRKEQKKIKRRRKKGKVLEEGKENYSCYSTYVKDDDEHCSCNCKTTNSNEDNEYLLKNLEKETDKKEEDIRGNCGDLWLDGNVNKKCNCCEIEVTENDFGESKSRKENGSTSDHSHDCGYSSENNNGCCETGSLVSSIGSSPESSDVACSENSWHQDHDYFSNNNNICRITSFGADGKLSLQEMLRDNCDEDDSDCYITAEEVREFKSNNREVYEKRQELREILKSRFAQFCMNGPLQVPRLLIQTKYASN